MIPKIIHYVWLGNAPLPEDMQECMDSWKKWMPEYQLMRWDDEAIRDIDSVFVREALAERKWAFASDVIRLYVIHKYGGIYMDTDVMVYTKMLATKGDSWINESEVRIVTDKPGKQRFLPSVLTGVIFGTNTNTETNDKILEAFKGRSLDVFQLHKMENTYEYFIEPLTPLIRKQELPSNSYDYVNSPSSVVDNYYVKSHKLLVSENLIRSFVKKFKHDV
jgi:hypothetical protein